jgi:hypothetical protein
MLDELQTLENPALRTFLKVDKSVEGIVVHRPDLTNSSSSPEQRRRWRARLVCARQRMPRRLR